MIRMHFLRRQKVRQKLGKMNRHSLLITATLESGMGPEIPKSLVSLLLENGTDGC